MIGGLEFQTTINPASFGFVGRSGKEMLKLLPLVMILVGGCAGAPWLRLSVYDAANCRSANLVSQTAWRTDLCQPDGFGRYQRRACINGEVVKTSYTDAACSRGAEQVGPKFPLDQCGTMGDPQTPLGWMYFSCSDDVAEDPPVIRGRPAYSSFVHLDNNCDNDIYQAQLFVSGKCASRSVYKCRSEAQASVTAYDDAQCTRVAASGTRPANPHACSAGVSTRCSDALPLHTSYALVQASNASISIWSVVPVPGDDTTLEATETYPLAFTGAAVMAVHPLQRIAVASTNSLTVFELASSSLKEVILQPPFDISVPLALCFGNGRFFLVFRDLNAQSAEDVSMWSFGPGERDEQGNYNYTFTNLETGLPFDIDPGAIVASTCAVTEDALYVSFTSGRYTRIVADHFENFKFTVKRLPSILRFPCLGNAASDGSPVAIMLRGKSSAVANLLSLKKLSNSTEWIPGADSNLPCYFSSSEDSVVFMMNGTMNKLGFGGAPSSSAQFKRAWPRDSLLLSLSE